MCVEGIFTSQAGVGWLAGRSKLSEIEKQFQGGRVEDGYFFKIL